MWRDLTDLYIVAELGNAGWDWDGLEPYYKKVRNRFGCNESRANNILGGTNDPTGC